MTEIDASKFTIDYEGLVGFRGPLSAEELRSQELVISSGDTWAIKITKDGIISNPDVPTDEGAKAIFEALEVHVRNLRA